MSERSTAPTDQPAPRGDELGKRAAVAQRRAWLSLVLFPVSVVGAFLVGEGLASLFGYEGAADETAPLWVALVAGGSALLVFAVPGVLAVYFGRLAMRLGRRDGLAPALVGAAIAGVFILQNALAYVVGTLLD